MERRITLPADKETLKEFRAGDTVYVSGVIYTARDAAHARMYDCLLASGIPGTIDGGNAKEAYKKKAKEILPFDFENSAIYYMGPSPKRDGAVIGAAGPTTSDRMDAYAPLFYDLGISITIGKGRRSKEVKEAIVRNSCVYLAAVGGVAALLSKSIISCEVIAFDDLGTEAIRKLTVKDMPLIVATDSKGNDVYCNI